MPKTAWDKTEDATSGGAGAIPPEDDSGRQALLRLHRRQTGRRVLMLVGVLVAVGLAVAVARIIVGDAPAPPPSKEIAQDLPADALAGLPDGTRARLLRDTIDRPAVFKRVYGGHPADLCTAILELGVPMSDWKPDPFVAGFWYCASELVVLGRTAPDGRRATLFVNLRGQSEISLNTVRIKLNAENPETVSQARASLVRVLEAVGARYGWPWPEGVRQAVLDNRAASFEQYGMTVTILPEDPDLTGDLPGVVRVNVIVEFPVVDLVAPAEIFAPFAWEVERASKRKRNRPVGGADSQTRDTRGVSGQAAE
ncbi:DUF6030 family protein [Stappia sp. ES.058]|uniref:DUF6030 family protein n=1 Tax=Stappia sp. ES.058 TaxID=1881061 RepID=UPI0012FDC53A|nr:DUF6030 family protein [Stappia sp. ES.058]